jgi:hypothetical protein
MRPFGRWPRGCDLPDNHEENGSSGDGRRRALTVVGSFSEQIDAISTNSVQPSLYLFIPARLALFSPATAQHGETSPAVDGLRSGYVRRQGV